MCFMDFKNAKELLALCQEKKLPISEVMRQREILLGETTAEIVDQRMDRVLEIMKDAAFSPIKDPVISMGGLIGGEARKLCEFHDLGKSLCGNVLGKGITYAMATLETNASMGLIVASPTAGSAGIVPGMMLALQEVYGFSDKKIRQALFNAGAIGYLAMRNATVAGAVGGCQAEVGIASAMAASAAVELLGGTPLQCTYAASTVLMNMLGLVCDPVGGLVEYPCQNRNAAGVSNALIAAEMSLAGIPQFIPLDEMIDAMYTVGKKLPAELRETALGGCAATPSACEKCHLCS
jgi:L-serine dehydratase